MDEDKLAGAARDAMGTVKEKLGSAVGDDGMKARGTLDQASGTVQRAYGSAKEAVRENAGGLAEELGGFVQDRPLLALVGALGVGVLIGRMIDR